MTRTDTTVVGSLVVLLALIAGLVGIPALQATTARPSATPGPSGIDVFTRPYREGVLSRPISVSPLTARTQADRDLVALVFSGLVRNGPDGTIVPDLARSWSVDETGRVWTFELQPDARWHDGEAVTSADVAYTIQTLQDPEYTGPASTSWSEVTVSTPTPGEVVFTLATPLGDFLQAATQPIAPVHLLGEIPIDLLADAPFGRQPVGSGPFALTSLSDDEAVLVPADPSTLGGGTPAVPSLAPSVAPTDSLVTAAPTLRPDRPVPYLPGIELHFYSDATTLAAAYRAGDLDAVSGLPPGLAADLATGKDTRLLRYPGSTLTAVLLNQRPTHPEFRDPAVRTALLAAIDRGSLIDAAWTSLAVAAPGPIPPSSPLFDKAAEPLVPFSLDAARKALKKAGWTSKADGWYLPGAKKPLTIDLVTPEQSANPGAFAAAQAVARDWETLGLAVSLVPLPPSQLINERLITGDFAAAVTDINIGFDPDLYALFASSQTRNGGSNLQGVQNLALDRLLVAARAPGTDDQRKAAYSALQAELGNGRYLLPLAYADEVAVVRHTLTGPVVRQVADPADRFWDVLTWRLAADR